MASDLRECCSECTIYGDDFGNPFKQMLLLMPHNTVLQDIIVAISVYHQARAGASPVPAEQDLASSLGKTKLETTSIDQATVMIHAYKATHSLRTALTSGDYSEAVVASSFLFTWLDMLDTELPSWHHHLAGMKDLMCLRETKDESASAGSSVFHRFFREAYAMYVKRPPFPPKIQVIVAFVELSFC